MAQTSISSTEITADSITRYLPYLREIQRKLIILAVITFTSGILGFIYYQKIISLILGSFNLKGITVVLTSPYQFFDLAINTGLITGIIVAFPLLIYYLFGFLKPALAPKEYKLVARLIPVSLLLFIAGFAFGVWIMQFVITIYSQTTTSINVGNLWDISHFFSQVLVMGLCMGLVFELPVVITVLIRLNIIKRDLLAKNRRVAYAAIVVFAAVMPPNDVVSLSLLTLAPLFLFEATLLCNRIK